MTQFSLTIDNYNRLHGTVIAWWLWTILIYLILEENSILLKFSRHCIYMNVFLQLI